MESPSQQHTKANNKPFKILPGINKELTGDAMASYIAYESEMLSLYVILV